MYRAVTCWPCGAAWRRSDGEALARSRGEHPVEIEPTGDGDRVLVDGQDVTEEIRTPEVAAQVSEVSAHAAVREEMVAAQRALMSTRRLGLRRPGRRQHVCPDADVKVFLTATPEERARRRRAELAADGMELDEATVLEDVLRRDELDSTRAASPLRVRRRGGRDRLVRTWTPAGWRTSSSPWSRQLVASEADRPRRRPADHRGAGGSSVTPG